MATGIQKKAKKRRKNRKHGRQKTFCLHYKNSHRRERNKIKRLNRHLKRFPGDRCASTAVEHCKALIRGY